MNSDSDSGARWKFLWRGMHSIGTKRLPQQFVMFSAPQKQSRGTGQGGAADVVGGGGKQGSNTQLANVAN